MPVTRRKFLKRSSALAMGAMIPSVARTAPSDVIRVGAIGINGMGWSNVQSFLQMEDVEIAALCDIDGNVLDSRAAELQDLTGGSPSLHGDFRHLLDQDDIDAVIIATPDHWHPLITIAACETGKDVYVEKPLANSIEECNVMIQAASHYERIVQIGQWQRSGPHWKDAVAFVHSGQLGTIRTVKAWAYQGWMSNIPVLPDEAPPPGVDYDMWLGPAPRRPFNPNRFHFTFRWFWDYAGGLMTDWGVHLIDTVLYGMQAVAPRSVLSAGGPFAYPHGGMETPDTQQAIFDYGDFTLLWEHAAGIDNGPYGRTHGVAFIGNNGTLVVDRAGWQVIPEGEKMEAVPVRPVTEPGLSRHTKNFADCIKTREEPACPPRTAWRAAVNAHLGNVAFRTDRKVFWDQESLSFPGDAEANALIRSHYRSPWELPTFG